MENRKNVKALHLDGTGSWVRTEKTACEFPLNIMLNGDELVTVICSPADPEALAVGFLASEGIIRTRKEIQELTFDGESGIIRIRTTENKTETSKLFKDRFLTTGCGRGISFSSYDDIDLKMKIFSDIRLTREDVLSLYHRFQKNSVLYSETHAVHSAALCDTKEILVFTEDIGRHNTVDRIIGRCILEGIAMTDRILAISGRISGEIIFKAAGFNIPVLISKSAPTDRGVDLARKLGITLIGFIYGCGMNVYAGEERVDTRRLLI
jgi:FdhD protein